MDIEVSIGKEALSFNIENPHRVDISPLVKNIVDFGKKFNVDLGGLKIEELVPKMVRGVAGCEDGCPANAKSLVREGVGVFNLSYIEGGILSAVHILDNGMPLSLKIFPEFD
ncbi:MAG: hypothetical protein V3R54_07265 [Thermodesulfovibrionia bacterium]